MNLEELKKIPIFDVTKYIDIRKQKNQVIKEQKYQEAAILRDREILLIKKYPVLDTIIEYEDLIPILRDRKINDIIDDTI